MDSRFIAQAGGHSNKLTIMINQNMSKYSTEPQRWGPGTGSEVNAREQVAKPKLALMEGRG